MALVVSSQNTTIIETSSQQLKSRRGICYCNYYCCTEDVTIVRSCLSQCHGPSPSFFQYVLNCLYKIKNSFSYKFPTPFAHSTFYSGNLEHIVCDKELFRCDSIETNGNRSQLVGYRANATYKGDKLLKYYQPETTLEKTTAELSRGHYQSDHCAGDVQNINNIQVRQGTLNATIIEKNDVLRLVHHLGRNHNISGVMMYADPKCNQNYAITLSDKGLLSVFKNRDNTTLKESPEFCNRKCKKSEENNKPITSYKQGIRQLREEIHKPITSYKEGTRQQREENHKPINNNYKEGMKQLREKIHKPITSYKEGIRQLRELRSLRNPPFKLTEFQSFSSRVEQSMTALCSNVIKNKEEFQSCMKHLKEDDSSNSKYNKKGTEDFLKKLRSFQNRYKLTACDVDHTTKKTNDATTENITDEKSPIRQKTESTPLQISAKVEHSYGNHTLHDSIERDNYKVGRYIERTNQHCSDQKTNKTCDEKQNNNCHSDGVVEKKNQLRQKLIESVNLTLNDPCRKLKPCKQRCNDELPNQCNKMNQIYTNPPFNHHSTVRHTGLHCPKNTRGGKIIKCILSSPSKNKNCETNHMSRHVEVIKEYLKKTHPSINLEASERQNETMVETVGTFTNKIDKYFRAFPGLTNENRGNFKNIYKLKESQSLITIFIPLDQGTYCEVSKSGLKIVDPNTLTHNVKSDEKTDSPLMLCIPLKPDAQQYKYLSKDLNLNGDKIHPKKELPKKEVYEKEESKEIKRTLEKSKSNKPACRVCTNRAERAKAIKKNSHSCDKLLREIDGYRKKSNKKRAHSSSSFIHTKQDNEAGEPCRKRCETSQKQGTLNPNNENNNALRRSNNEKDHCRKLMRRNSSDRIVSKERKERERRTLDRNQNADSRNVKDHSRKLMQGKEKHCRTPDRKQNDSSSGVKERCRKLMQRNSSDHIVSKERKERERRSRDRNQNADSSNVKDHYKEKHCKTPDRKQNDSSSDVKDHCRKLMQRNSSDHIASKERKERERRTMDRNYNADSSNVIDHSRKLMQGKEKYYRTPDRKHNDSSSDNKDHCKELMRRNTSDRIVSKGKEEKTCKTTDKNSNVPTRDDDFYTRISINRRRYTSCEKPVSRREECHSRSRDTTSVERSRDGIQKTRLNSSRIRTEEFSKCKRHSKNGRKKDYFDANDSSQHDTEKDHCKKTAEDTYNKRVKCDKNVCKEDNAFSDQCRNNTKRNNNKRDLCRDYSDKQKSRSRNDDKGDHCRDKQQSCGRNDNKRDHCSDKQKSCSRNDDKGDHCRDKQQSCGRNDNKRDHYSDKQKSRSRNDDKGDHCRDKQQSPSRNNDKRDHCRDKQQSCSRHDDNKRDNCRNEQESYDKFVRPPRGCNKKAKTTNSTRWSYGILNESEKNAIARELMEIRSEVCDCINDTNDSAEDLSAEKCLDNTVKCLHKYLKNTKQNSNDPKLELINNLLKYCSEKREAKNKYKNKSKEYCKKEKRPIEGEHKQNVSKTNRGQTNQSPECKNKQNLPRERRIDDQCAKQHQVGKEQSQPKLNQRRTQKPSACRKKPCQPTINRKKYQPKLNQPKQRPRTCQHEEQQRENHRNQTQQKRKEDKSHRYSQQPKQSPCRKRTPTRQKSPKKRPSHQNSSASFTIQVVVCKKCIDRDLIKTLPAILRHIDSGHSYSSYNCLICDRSSSGSYPTPHDIPTDETEREIDNFEYCKNSKIKQMKCDQQSRPLRVKQSYRCNSLCNKYQRNTAGYEDILQKIRSYCNQHIHPPHENTKLLQSHRKEHGHGDHGFGNNINYKYTVWDDKCAEKEIKKLTKLFRT